MITNKWKSFFLCWLFIFLSACGNKILDKQEVIDIALEIASSSMPEYSSSQIPPLNIYAEQMTLLEAGNLFDSKITLFNNSPELSVWVVRMDGIWLPVDVPDLPMQEPYRHLYIVIDAKTGLEVFRNLQP